MTYKHNPKENLIGGVLFVIAGTLETATAFSRYIDGRDYFSNLTFAILFLVFGFIFISGKLGKK